MKGDNRQKREGVRSMGCGVWGVGCGVRSMDYGLWTMDYGLWAELVTCRWGLPLLPPLSQPSVWSVLMLPEQTACDNDSRCRSLKPSVGMC